MSLKKLIRKGDTTTHGGIVIEGNTETCILGKEAACIGHMVYCPKCHGVYPIIEGVSGLSLFGDGVAVEGMKTACGAQLISSQDSFVLEALQNAAYAFSNNNYSSFLVASLNGDYGAPVEDVKRPEPEKKQEVKYERVSVMINDNTGIDYSAIWGTHAGLMIGESGKSSSMIYDPSGSYNPCKGKRNCDPSIIGANRTVEGRNTDFQHYLQYQYEDGKDVFVYLFLVETQYIKQIKDRIYAQGGGGNYQCTTMVSQALTNIPPFGKLNYSKPRYLKNRLIEIQKDLWTKK